MTRARALCWLLGVALLLQPVASVAQPSSDSSAAARARWQQMSPDQKQRVREAFRAFSRLPKPEQHRIVERYKHFRSRSAVERQSLRDQYRSFRRLPPNERRAIRQSFERYRKLSQAQRERMRHSFRQLSKLSPSERQRFLAKLERWRELSPEQREKVRAWLKKNLRDNRTRTH